MAALERKLELWENGNMKLLNEGQSIQERLPTVGRPKDIPLSSKN